MRLDFNNLREDYILRIVLKRFNRRPDKRDIIFMLITNKLFKYKCEGFII